MLAQFYFFYKLTTSTLTKLANLNFLKCIRGSSSGRTTGSDSVYQGSNPCPRTNIDYFDFDNFRLKIEF